MRLSRFNMCGPVDGELFVNRDKELCQTVDWIVSGTGNLIISGERGIGKTSLAWKAIADTIDKRSGTLLMRETVCQFRGEGFETFLSELGKRITVTIWQSITGRSFSELLSDSLDFGENKIEPRDVTALRRIYSILSASQLTSKATKSSRIGGKLVIEAGTQEGLETGMVRTAITSFEFLAIVDELKELASRHGFPRIVVLADEFNYLLPSEQGDFVRSYFEVLNARSIVFGLIGIDLDPWVLPGLSQCVETYIPLGPFDSAEHVQALVRAGLRAETQGTVVDFLGSENICDEIFSETQGNPRLIQMFCCRFVEQLPEDSAMSDLQRLFEETRRQLAEQREREEEMMQRMKG